MKDAKYEHDFDRLGIQAIAGKMVEKGGLWRLLNRQIIRVLSGYPADRLQAKCDNNKKEVSLHTVEWQAQDYVEHLNHHLNQVYKN